MKKNLKNWLILLLLMTAFAVNAFSAGVGFFMPITFGSGADSFDGEHDWGFTNSGFGLGFVFDTKVAGDKLFNYRLNAGYNYIKSKTDDYNFYNSNINNSFGFDRTKHKIAFDNSIGFGVLRLDFMRLWLGPQIRLNFEYAEGTAECISCSFSNNSLSYWHFSYGIGIAPVIGMNFNIGSGLTIGTDMGYRFSGNVGFGEKDDYSNYYGSELNTFGIITGEREFFLNISLIFRFNDEFNAVSSSRKNRR